MSIRRLPLSRSVIVDVIRAIISRPISNFKTQPLTFTCTNKKIVTCSTQRLYSTHATSLAIKESNENKPELISPLDNDTKKKEKIEKYHLLSTVDANGRIRKNVKGFTLKEKKEKPKNVLEYNRLMLFASRQDRLNKAIRIFREMENSGLKPNVCSYTIIINGFSKQSDMKRARRWFRRMYENNVMPDANVYTSLIDGYMREANVDQAENIFKKMMKKKIKPTLVTYNILMHHSVRKLNTESALKFWSSLLEAGLKSDVFTFAIILHGLGNEGRVDEAWRIYKTMQEESVDVNAVVATTLMEMHVKQHDNEYALNLFNNFFHKNSNLRPTAHTRNVLLNAIVSQADNDTIQKYYEQYLNSLKETTATESPLFAGANVYTYTTFMRAFLRRNNLLMVSQVYQDMISRHIQPSLVTYATLMLAHAYVPDPEACQRIFTELKNNGIELNAVIYTIVMRAWAKAGRWGKVKDTYDLMKKDNIKPTKLTMEVLRYGRSRSNEI